MFQQTYPSINHRSKSTLVLALVFVTGVLALTGFIGTPSASASAPAPNPSTAKYEINYMEMLSDHHFGGIKVDQQCVAKAIHEALKDNCQTDIKDQQKQIDEMHSWLKKWYGIEYQPKVMPDVEAILQYLTPLHGKAFEVAVMENLIPHHLQAINMSKVAEVRAYHHDLKDLAKEVVTGQTKSIHELTDYLCNFYGICN